MNPYTTVMSFVSVRDGKIFHRIVRDPNDTGGTSAGITLEGHIYDNEFGIIESHGHARETNCRTQRGFERGYPSRS